jgi:uncharacterized BrkB/YihY/UPF0761 family membrane protein
MKLQTAVPRFFSLVSSVVRRAGNTGLARTAGSLAFTTVLGLVPVATVALAFVARFPIFQQWLDALEGFLLKYTLPAARTRSCIATSGNSPRRRSGSPAYRCCSSRSRRRS